MSCVTPGQSVAASRVALLEAAEALRTSEAAVLADLDGLLPGDSSAAGCDRLLGRPLLGEVARFLERDETASEDGFCDPSRGRQAWGRAVGDDELGRLFREAGLLRAILPRHLERPLGRGLTPDEQARLHAALDACLRARVEALAAEQRERLRAETDAMAKYLSFLSHDLRGNLNGAMLMIEILRHDLQGDERFAESVGDLDAMRGSMLGLVGTMDRFLQAERLRNGRVEISPSRVDLEAFLREQCRQIERQTRGGDGRPAAGLPVEIDFACDGEVVTDRELLGLILQNLLGNCVKYGAGRPVRLEARPGDGDARLVRIEVSDRGPGMDQSLVARLFQPFTRGHHSAVPGTGLGLFIAKQSADLLRAGLRVESVEHQGTRFLIDLPRSC